MSQYTLEQAREEMERCFGFTQFRPGQQAVLKDILDRHHVVAIMPTGAGKSLLYQLPAMLLPGTVLVISPLISLMKDQVDGLLAKNIQAAFINSTLTSSQRRVISQNMELGCYQLVYVAPERLQTYEFQDSLRRTKIAMLAVDEAHCVSQWGHDFRPDYLKIRDCRECMGNPQTVAFTATATTEVRREIAQRLGLEQWKDHIAGFDRDNLFFEVRSVSGQKDKVAHIVDIFEKSRGAGIVYAGTRKNVEFVVSHLHRHSIEAMAYHGGMEDYVRDAVQEQFMSGKIPLIVATNAFGMGIDKPDIRFVIHFDIPGNIESYYQEIGRAGRDGQKAHCCLLFNYADTRIPRFFIEESHPEPSIVMRMADLLSQQQLVPSATELATRFTLSGNMAIRYALGLIERAGLIAKGNLGDVYVCTPHENGPEILSQLLALDQQRRENEQRKLQQMSAYAYHKGCRRSWILDYFGDIREHAQCKACDNCQKLTLQQEITGERLIEVLKALSAVARLNGKLGKAKIVQVLMGSKSEAISKHGFHRIPTYGALKYMKKTDVSQLIEELVAAGYIEIRLKKGNYPLLHLTKTGNEVMMRREPCYLEDLRWSGNSTRSEVVPKKPQKNEPATAEEDPFDEMLYEKLAEKRRDIARQIGKPLFIVFSNKTLQEMARKKPQNLDEMAQVSGVGEVKLQQYGEIFVEVIGIYCKKTSVNDLQQK